MPAKTAPILLVATAALAVACSDGEPGDLAKVPEQPPNVVGTGSRLSDLNDPEKPRPPQNGDVLVTGVSVVSVDTFDETNDGASAGNIYVQDLATAGPPPAYGGITLFDASFNPPALRVGPGDVVDVRGAYQEFAGPPPPNNFADGETLPEIVGGSISLRFEYLPPEPFEISLEDLSSYATGRKWIGMLVRVTNITASEDGFKSGSGRYSIRLQVAGGTNPTLTNALFDLEKAGVPLTAGAKYASVVGVVQYFFNFSIAPRSAADVVPEGVTP